MWMGWIYVKVWCQSSYVNHIPFIVHEKQIDAICKGENSEAVEDHLLY